MIYQGQTNLFGRPSKTFLKRCHLDPTLKSFLCPQFTDFLDKVVFVLDKAFKPSLMFAGRAWAYPSETPFRFSTLMLVSKGRST
jgi:hypothetical protein